MLIIKEEKIILKSFHKVSVLNSLYEVTTVWISMPEKDKLIIGNDTAMSIMNTVKFLHILCLEFSILIIPSAGLL